MMCATAPATGGGRSAWRTGSLLPAARRSGCAAWAIWRDLAGLREGAASSIPTARGELLSSANDPRRQPILRDGYGCAERRRLGMSVEFNVLALIKGEERYVYVTDDASHDTLVETFQLQ